MKYIPDSTTTKHIYHNAHVKVLIVARGNHLNRFLKQQVCPVKFQFLYWPLLLMVSYHVQEFIRTPPWIQEEAIMVERPIYGRQQQLHLSDISKMGLVALFSSY